MKNSSRIHFAGIIPARYASTRFPGKPLAMINGKPMIRRVYEQAQKSIETIFVATDDQRIFDVVAGFGGNAVMTSADHQSGTDRCAEAAEIITLRIGTPIDVVVNIQGDEPFIRPEQIELLKSCFDDETVEIATLVRKTGKGEDIFNPNQPKVVLDKSGNAIYFSRAAIPFIRNLGESLWSENHSFYKHLGLYAYTLTALKKITKLPAGTLEKAESLEQLRWLENGFRIRTATTEYESIGIDTPADLERALAFFDNLK